MKKYTLKRYRYTPAYILIDNVLRRLFETSIELFTVPKLDASFSHLPFSGRHAMQKLLREFKFNSILDIGSGQGLHAALLKDHNKQVSTIDYGASEYFKEASGAAFDSSNSIIADFNEHEFTCQYDAIWCSHVLEHQPNPNIFLRKIYSLLPDEGILAITVPPARKIITGGHLSNWSAGLLLYNLVLAGFDCKNASILKYDYNISIIVQKKQAICEDLGYDYGDIKKIKRFLPDLAFFSTGDDVSFNGNIFKVNW